MMMCFLSTPVFGKGEHQERQTKDPFPYQYRKPTVELLVSKEWPESVRVLQTQNLQEVRERGPEKMSLEFIFPET